MNAPSRFLARAALASLLALPAGRGVAGDPPAPGPAGTAAAPSPAPDRWAPLRPLLGTWEGTSRGKPGTGTVRREYRLILGERFIEARNRSSYAPTEKRPEGERHEDLGVISLDRARKLFVLRQFHVEGFVNTYTSPVDAAPGPMVFVTESIENIPPGWRARETWRLEGPDVLVEVFELAEPGKDFTTYSETRLTRAR
jgi:hypothetical protein